MFIEDGVVSMHITELYDHVSNARTSHLSYIMIELIRSRINSYVKNRHGQANGCMQYVDSPETWSQVHDKFVLHYMGYVITSYTMYSS